VGAFLLVALVATLGVLFTMTDAAMFRGRYIVTTHVDNAGGIRKGDPVQMRGVNVGRVLRFKIAEKSVAVELEIEGEYTVPKDSKVLVRSAGLLGGMVADIQPGGAAEVLRYGDTVAGEREEQVADIAGKLADTLDQAQTALTGAEQMLSKETADNVREGSAEARSLLRKLSGTVTEQRGELLALSKSLRRSAEGLEKTATGPEIDRTVKRIDALATRVDEIATTLDRSSKSLETVLGRLERGEGTLGKLSKDEELYDNLNSSARKLREVGDRIDSLITDIQKNPKRYFKFSVF
jgi:phospholipid/cholesterol/gamma-HCH transport system substrate-binding protein